MKRADVHKFYLNKAREIEMTDKPEQDGVIWCLMASDHSGEWKTTPYDESETVHGQKPYVPASNVEALRLVNSELLKTAKEVSNQLAKEIAGFKMLYYKGMPSTGKSILNDMGSLCSKLEQAAAKAEALATKGEPK